MTDEVLTRADRPGEVIAGERRARPVVVWAVVGVMFAALTVYIFTDYVFSGNFPKSVDKGSDPVPTYMVVWCRIFEVLFVVGFLIFVYKVIVKPWRRERRLGLDALLFFAFWGIVWQDPLYSYTQQAYTYNPGFINVRSWGGSIPGFVPPHAEKIPYPVFAIIFAYPVVWLGMAMFGAWLMRRLKQRWPAMGTAELIAVCFLAMVVVDLVAEVSMIRFGFWTYPGAIKGVTLFQGHFYQFPLYELVTFTLPLTLFSALYYFRNDRGETLAERGINGIRVQGWRQTALRFLALLGIANVIWLCSFNIPSMLINLHQSDWPQDFQKSYLNLGVCGPGTTYACPGPNIPLNRPHSIHIDPHGNAVAPGPGN